MFIPPLRIALNGGGIRGIAHLGALDILEQKGHLSCVREYIGVSAGAFCAFCLCIGYTIDELKRLTVQMDLGLLRKLEPETMFELPEVFGLDSGENIMRLFTILLEQKGFSPNVTFEELASASASAKAEAKAKTEKKTPGLRIFAMDLNTCRPYEYSLAKTPTIEVRLAVRASVSLPIYFTPVTDPEIGHTMIDSLFLSDAPFSFLTDEERAHTLNLAFHVGDSCIETIDTLFGFLGQLYHTACKTPFTDECLKRWGHTVVNISCRTISSMHFEATEEEKLELIRLGQEAMLRFLEQKNVLQRFLPQRRFSQA